MPHVSWVLICSYSHTNFTCFFVLVVTQIFHGVAWVVGVREWARKEWRPTCISTVSTQLTKCSGIGELPNLHLPRHPRSHRPCSGHARCFPVCMAWLIGIVQMLAIGFGLRMK
jgi:hypothetical protein